MIGTMTMIKMIRITLLAGVLMSVFSFSGCSFLNVEVVGKNTIEAFFKDYDSFRAAGEGLHRTMFDFYDDQFIRYAEIKGDLVNVNAINADEGILALFNYELTPSYISSFPQTLWKSGYIVITNANNIIEYGPRLKDDFPNRTEAIDSIVASAHFARALAHFDLCNCYAQPYNYTEDASHIGIPVVDHIPGFDDVIDRKPVSQVYSLILSDLHTAEDLFKETADFDIYHVSKVACEALLARVYLYMEDYENAEIYAKKVMDKIPLTPASAYVSMFRNPNSDRKVDESIFRLNGAFLTSSMNALCDPTKSIKIEPDPTIVNYYDINDVRRELFTYIPESIEGDVYQGQTYPAICKFLYYKSNNVDYRCTDPFVLRCSEMYLIHAEALCNGSKQDLDGAAQDLKALIARALDITVDEVSLIYSSKEDMQNLIERERIKELCYEGHRIFDIIRNKKNLVRSSETNSTVKTINYPDYRFVLPISQLEMQSNPDMVQNQGY